MSVFFKIFLMDPRTFLKENRSSNLLEKNFGAIFDKYNFRGFAISTTLKKQLNLKKAFQEYLNDLG